MAQRFVIQAAGILLLLNCGLAGCDDARTTPQRPTASEPSKSLTEPLTPDGVVDYAARINQGMSVDVTAENNAVVAFFLAHGPEPNGKTMPEGFSKLLGIPTPPADGEYFVDIGDHLEKLGMLREDPLRQSVLDHLSEALTGPWTREDYPHIALWLDANTLPLIQVVEGARRPRYYSPLVVGSDVNGGDGGLASLPTPGLRQLRAFGRALTARAMLRLGEGDSDAAWQDLLSCQQLGRVLTQGPSLIDVIQGIAICNMAAEVSPAFVQHSSADANQIARYRRDLDQLVPIRLSTVADRLDLTERCVLLDCMTRIARGGEVPKDFMFWAGFDSLQMLTKQPHASRVDWDTANRTANAWCNRYVGAMRESEYRRRHIALKMLTQELEGATARFNDQKEFAEYLQQGDARGPALGQAVGEAIVSLLVPGVEACGQATDRITQIDRNLRLAFALAAYRADRNQYPDRLDELSPQYINSIPTDLYSDKPLRYQRSAEGYLLYSVGENESDDGGHWYNDEPKGDDPRVRMPQR